MRQITREDFIAFPEQVTKLPVYDTEDGEILGWGHLDKQEVITALQAIGYFYGFVDGEFDDLSVSEIQHTYGKPNPIDGLEEDEIAFVLCAKEDEGAFPVTYVQL
jgi:hypothetical protein